MAEIWIYHAADGFHSMPHRLVPDELWQDKERFFWLDMEKPDDEELEWVRTEFDIHPIAMEDYNSPQERPRIDHYPKYYSIVLFALSFDREECKLHEKPLTIFVGPRFMVTLHADPIPEIASARDLWKRIGMEMDPEIGVPLYALIDSVVDHYFPLIDFISEEVEDLEDRVLTDEGPAHLERVFQLKRQLLYLRRAVAPQRDVLHILLRRELLLFSEHTSIYFSDVYDHLIEIIDSVDTHRDLISGAVDLHVSVASNRLALSANRLNETMKILTSWSIILMAASLIAGIYGMNFKWIPELDWHYGYFYGIGLMVLLGGGLITFFKRREWL